MPVSRFVNMLVLIFALCSASVAAFIPAAHATEAGPIGAWRTTNGCFLSAFLLSAGGGAQAAYLSGERDDYAAWDWDGVTLEIISEDFPLDSFSGRVTGDQMEADYVWHDFDTDEFNSQSCIFEKFAQPES